MPDIKYCYPNTNVLINKLGITDPAELENAERKLTAYNIANLIKTPIKGRFDLLHLRKIHKSIFQDLYSWAGELRVVDISKDSTGFCRFEFIESYLSGVLSKLPKENYLVNASFADKIKGLSFYLAEINAAHPFREGNGRTQRVFIESLGKVAGVEVDFSKTSSEKMLEASIHSFSTDNTLFDKILNEITSPIDKLEQLRYTGLIFGDAQKIVSVETYEKDKQGKTMDEWKREINKRREVIKNNSDRSSGHKKRFEEKEKC